VVDSLGRVTGSLAAVRARITSLGAIELKIQGKITREFRGDLAIDAPGGGALRIVVATNRESAVASAVAAEMKSRRKEALRAMAIVTRSFMLSHAGRHAGEGFDYCDTTHCQLYRGEADFTNEARRIEVADAVAATEGEFLGFGASVVETYFTAVCGGLSATPTQVWGGATGEYGYQRIECRWCRRSPYNNWERSAQARAVLSALSSATGVNLSQEAEVAIEKMADGDLVRSVRISDRGRQVILSTEEFRRAIGFRLGWNKVLSPTFQIERRPERFIFRGRGFGSQVGLCLEGATRQAEAGRSHGEILLYYFPRTKIEKMNGRAGEWERRRSFLSPSLFIIH
jgi:stage II sporulation protein D